MGSIPTTLWGETLPFNIKYMEFLRGSDGPPPQGRMVFCTLLSMTPAAMA